mmetsp:Transcript_689/g.2776  ORF Transcript_689/g.2776 Transcript_689/m.2776 type:complete len:310 (-) Transcript_689:123-1052(-)|eukprot:scaffold757_cov246-Pinguiococcus_pyrenoidosus.AAC.16
MHRHRRRRNAHSRELQADTQVAWAAVPVTSVDQFAEERRIVAAHSEAPLLVEISQLEGDGGTIMRLLRQLVSSGDDGLAPLVLRHVSSLSAGPSAVVAFIGARRLLATFGAGARVVGLEPQHSQSRGVTDRHLRHRNSDMMVVGELREVSSDAVPQNCHADAVLSSLRIRLVVPPQEDGAHASHGLEVVMRGGELRELFLPAGLHRLLPDLVEALRVVLKVPVLLLLMPFLQSSQHLVHRDLHRIPAESQHDHAVDGDEVCAAEGDLGHVSEAKPSRSDLRDALLRLAPQVQGAIVLAPQHANLKSLDA